jgi:predicted enzyme involved in methoxymalonyl-ACP biosynthesis
MSCRVLGRGVEAVVLAELGRIATDAGCTAVTGSYIPTERNGMVADLYPRHGFAETDSAEGAGHAGATRWTVIPAALTAPGTHIHLTRD